MALSCSCNELSQAREAAVGVRARDTDRRYFSAQSTNGASGETMGLVGGRDFLLCALCLQGRVPVIGVAHAVFYKRFALRLRVVYIS